MQKPCGSINQKSAANLPPAGLYLGVRGDVVGNPLIGAQNAALANGYVAKNGGFGIDDDVILYIGVAFNAFYGVAVFVQGETFCP